MFKVPIIPPDLRHEETITQAAYALDCLQNTIATIFGRIDKRLETNNVKVKELQERIRKSQDKINSLQGTRKAIHIYAPARFPATNVFKDLPVTFEQEKITTAKTAATYKIESKLDTNLPSLNEKLIFFHVREQNTAKQNTDNNLLRERIKIKQNQDLGNMPSDLRSIPSVLLFNTDCSVYDLEEGDSETDAWKRAKYFKSKRLYTGSNQPMTTKQILEPAPHSLVNRRNEKLTPSGGLKYTPKLSEAPELDLPLDLPDLPGIADDLRYESQEAKQKIAPSLALVVENLPELAELMNDNEKNSNIPLEQRNNNTNKTTSPPPPPPPMPVIQSAAGAPPPPPPPPPVLQTTPNTTTKTNKSKTPSSSDTRSELMAAIRNAGGVGKAALRHTAAAAPLANSNNDVVDTTHPPKTANTSRSHPAGNGDLMADLHNKLLMRRKGISGSKDNTDISTTTTTTTKHNNTTTLSNTPSGNPVISRLSALIPPPPAKAKHTATVTTSDEDDSNDTDWVD